MENRGLPTRIAELIAGGYSTERIYYDLLCEGLTVAEIQAAYAETTHSGRATTLQQRVVRIVVTTGAILVGAGAFSFVASNWADMSDPLRVAVIVLGMAAATASGWYLRESRGYQATGSALLLLGSIIFGAGIFLCAQIFNVHGNWPDGFVLWMLGALAMGYAARSNALYLLGVIVGGVAALGYPFLFLDFTSLDFFLLSSPLVVALGGAAALLAGIEARHRFLGEEGA